MSSTHYYGPVNESTTQIFFERCFMEGTLVGCIMYGVELMLFLKIVVLLFQKRKDSNESQLPISFNRASMDSKFSSGLRPLHIVRSRRPWWKLRKSTCLLVYISLIFLLNTLFIISAMLWLSLIFVNNRDYPGGPIAYSDEFWSSPLSNLGNVSFILSTWLADVVMLWRCMAIWKSSYMKVVMVLPCLAYFSTIGLGIGLMYEFAQSGTSLLSPEVARVGVPFYAISLTLNIAITLLIATRLLIHSRMISTSLGRGYAKKYDEIVAILIESAFLYAIVSVGLLTSYGANSGVQYLFLQSASQVQVIATFLIIVRVLKGTAVKMNSPSIRARPPSTLAFADMAASILVTRTTDIDVSPPLTTKLATSKRWSFKRPRASSRASKRAKPFEHLDPSSMPELPVDLVLHTPFKVDRPRTPRTASILPDLPTKEWNMMDVKA